jgi:disulfide bond formation protein DsbB
MREPLLKQNRRTFIALAAGGSAAMLLAAFGFQYIGGLAPCAMCLWQRWPHAVAIALGALSGR